MSRASSQRHYAPSYPAARVATSRMASLSDGHDGEPPAELPVAGPSATDSAVRAGSEAQAPHSQVVVHETLRNPLAERVQDLANASASASALAGADAGMSAGSGGEAAAVEAGPSRAPEHSAEEEEFPRGRQTDSRRIGEHAHVMEGDGRGIQPAGGAGARQPLDNEQEHEHERDQRMDASELEQQYMGEPGGEYEIMDERPPGGGKRVKARPAQGSTLTA